MPTRAAVLALHAPQVAPAAPPSGRRATNVLRAPNGEDEYARVARALVAAAIEASGRSLRTCADHARIDESTLRRKLAGVRGEQPTVRDLLRLPRSIKHDVARALLADEQVHGLSIDAHLRRLTSEVGDVARAADEGLAGDGILDDVELAKLEREAVEAERAAAAMVRDLRALRERREARA